MEKTEIKIKELSTLEIVNLLVKLSHDNPNDMELGKVIRHLIKK